MRPVILFLLPFLLLASACKPRRGPGKGSAAQSTVNQPVQGAGKWYWVDVTEAEFFGIIAPYLELGTKETKFVQSSPAVALRMTKWLETIHDVLKAAPGGADTMKDVPLPYVLVMNDPDANAFVPPVNTCFNLSLKLPGNDSSLMVERATLDPSGSITQDDSFSADGGPGLCLERNLNEREAREFVDWFNTQSDRLVTDKYLTQEKACYLRMAPGSLEVELNPEKGHCEVAEALTKYSKAKKVVFWQTANSIVVHSGLVTWAKEEKNLISTLAHEISHYYRSHTSVPMARYDYFYQLTSENPDGKPLPDHSFDAKALEIKAAAAYNTAPRLGTDSPIRSELFTSLVEISRLLCQAPGSCEKPEAAPCKSLEKRVRSKPFSTVMEGFPDDGDLTSRKRKYHFANFQRDWLACAPTAKLGLRKGDITQTSIQNALETSGLKETIVKTGSGWNQLLKGATTLQEVHSKLTATLATVDVNAPAIIARAGSNSIGMYTIEQEADEMAVELVYKLGFSPSELLKYDIEFYRDNEDQTPAYDRVNMAACEASLEKGWKEKRHFFIPPIGDFIEPHHSGCFRIYTSFKEIRKFEKADNPAPLNPALQVSSPDSWKALQEIAFDATGKPQQPPGSAGDVNNSPVASKKAFKKGVAARVSNSCGINGQWRRKARARKAETQPDSGG